MKIKIDTREQRPYEFKTPSEVGTIPIADYSICGLENHVSIERKEINDLIGCLSQDRERFERELNRGRALDYFALVVEGSLSALLMVAIGQRCCQGARFNRSWPSLSGIGYRSSFVKTGSTGPG